MNIAAYKSHVAGLGCILCRYLSLGETPAQLHHPRAGQGTAERASDWLIIPLCPEHHQGKSGLHGLGTRAFEARYKLSEMDLLAMTLKEVFRGL